MKKIVSGIVLSSFLLITTKNVYAIDLGKFFSSIFATKAGSKAVENDEGKDIEKFRSAKCTGLNPWGQVEISDEKVLSRSLYLCRNMYSVHYDSLYKTPLVVSEILTKNNIINPHVANLKYPILMPDPDLPTGMQVELKDYVGTVYEPFSLAPLADMYTYNENTKEEVMLKENQQSINESAYLSNTLPMASSLKKGLWNQLEMQIRSLLNNPTQDTLYVVTGPIYLNGQVKGMIGKKGVAIPTHYYKIIANPHTDGSLSYIIPNQNILANGVPKYKDSYTCNGGYCDLTSFIAPLKEIERLTGFVFFPKLAPQYARKVKLDLNEFYKKPGQK